MQENLLINFGLLLGFIIGFLLLGFLFQPAWAAEETRREQTTGYTVAFSSLVSCRRPHRLCQQPDWRL